MFTLQDIRDHYRCQSEWTKLLTALGNPPLTTTISLGDVALANGSQDAYRCVRVLDWSDIDLRRKVISAVLHSIKRAGDHAKDDRVHDYIAAIDILLYRNDTVDLKSAAAAEIWAWWAVSWVTEAASRAAEARTAEQALQVQDIVAIFPPLILSQKPANLED